MTAIDDFFTHYYARRPVNATFTGVHQYDRVLPDWSPDGLSAQDDEMRSLGLALAAEYPAPEAASTFRTSPDALDAELARAFLEVQRAENASTHGPRGNPALWTGEAIFSIISLMIRDFAPVEERVQLVAERLTSIPGFLEQFSCHCERSAGAADSHGHSERSAGGAESRNRRRPDRETLGRDDRDSSTSALRAFARNDTYAEVRAFARNDHTVPRQWLERALRDCDGAEVLLSTGIDRWLGTARLSASDDLRVRRCAGAARDAFRTFADSLPAHHDAPVEAMACGSELLDLLLSRGHFCERSRGDLLADARERFAAARAELDRLASSVAGSWADAQQQLASDRPAPDEYFPAFEKTWRACYELADKANAVSWPDNWPIRYAPYPAWTADAAPYLYYLHYRSPAPLDPYTAYHYVVPALPSDPDAADKHLRAWNHSTIKLNHVVHHGAIGHHVQNWYAYNQQRSRVGKVAGVDCANRIGMFCAGTMTEGWACYATDLMEELGFLTPLERVSQQHTRVRMLARAIVDIELHQGTMSFTEAIRFYVENVGMSDDAARGEATKNSMYPCTAIVYWLGTQGIHDLRDEMKRREGPRFSLRRFHGELLGYGSIPVPLVARIMTAGHSPRSG